MIALAIAAILVKHIWSSGFDLRFNDGGPKLLRLDRLTAASFPLILFVQIVKFVAPGVL